MALPPEDTPVFSLISDGMERVARGVVRRFDHPLRAPESVRAVLAALDARRGGTLVGAIPFDINAPACLIVPEHTEWRRVASPSVPSTQRRALRCSYAEDAARREVYLLAVRRALQALEGGDLEKVVLSRSVHEGLPDPVDAIALTHRLAAADPHCHVFALDLGNGAFSGTKSPGPGTDSGPRHWFVGASPELLLRRVGRYVVTNPLAGSIPCAASARENAALAQRLSGSEKDRREHAFVVDAIRSVLGPLCRSLTVPSGPEVIATSSVLHLSTLIVGELRDPGLSSLELALLLHPTPAVCGTPTAAAASLLAEIEDFDRGFFSGLVGWCDAAGDGCWVVSLRCGDVCGRDARLYAGAGIVKGSDPEREYLETEAKLETMRGALRGYVRR